MNKQTLKKTAGLTWAIFIMIATIALASGATSFTISDSSLSTIPYLEVEPASAVTGLLIDQNNNAIGLDIDSAATTSSGLVVNLAASNNAYSIFAKQDHASSTGEVIRAVNDGTGSGIVIDQNGNGMALNIDSEATTLPALLIAGGQVTTGGMLELVNSVAMTTNDGSGRNGVIWAEQSHASSTKPVLNLKNAGTGDGLFIDQNGDGIALEIDHEGATNSAIYVASANDGSAVGVNDKYGVVVATTQTGGLFRLDRDNAAPVTPVATILEDNTGSSQDALDIQNDGTGMHIALTGADNAACDATQSGIIANSTGVYACFGGAATKLT